MIILQCKQFFFMTLQIDHFLCIIDDQAKYAGKKPMIRLVRMKKKDAYYCFNKFISASEE